LNVHFIWWYLKIFGRSTNLNFYLFSSTLPNIKVVLRTHIIYNVICEDIPGNFNRLVTHNSSKSNNRDLGSTSTYIHDHISFWLHNINSNSNSSSHWLVDQIHFFAIHPFCTLFYRTHFHLGNSRWDTYHHP